ncbi:hypothetical protein Y032_0115g497 [Ancylostoma ceylanicum]|uniref:Uncharacterized protein n=1 Tax=Ancylostoma ceylanicum TaxID=53326 RepID=A0A016TCU0_9BILA|nr:hypothetical protein Y032_0115g497 [Ancylostoma ceylanicum]
MEVIEAFSANIQQNTLKHPFVELFALFLARLSIFLTKKARLRVRRLAHVGIRRQPKSRALRFRALLILRPPSLGELHTQCTVEVVLNVMTLSFITFILLRLFLRKRSSHPSLVAATPLLLHEVASIQNHSSASSLVASIGVRWVTCDFDLFVFQFEVV